MSFCFQRLMLSQNRRIDQLVEKIKQQQDKLEKQSLHLQTLQSKVSHTTFNRTPDMTKHTFTTKRKSESYSSVCHHEKTNNTVSYSNCNVIF